MVPMAAQRDRHRSADCRRIGALGQHHLRLMDIGLRVHGGSVHRGSRAPRRRHPHRLQLHGRHGSNLRKQGNLQLVDVTVRQGDTLTLAVNGTSNLPEWVSYVGPHVNLGDVTYRTHFVG
jgi:hypothetical protein